MQVLDWSSVGGWYAKDAKELDLFFALIDDIRAFTKRQ